MPSKLGAILRRFRENCELTQLQVANALQIDRSTYTCYETGKTAPSISTLLQLSKIFNTSYSELLEELDADTASVAVADAITERRSKSEAIVSSRSLQEKIYDLSHIEKDLLIRFRLLSNKEKEEFIQSLLSKSNL
ncbi:MAG: helix-turn-helix transcriptional regulator [Bacillota bacterium]|nr:helix-turn-helix transcriptional regulator [Bacillota bacterium]